MIWLALLVGKKWDYAGDIAIFSFDVGKKLRGS
jgi:hypothetical protein